MDCQQALSELISSMSATGPDGRPIDEAPKTSGRVLAKITEAPRPSGPVIITVTEAPKTSGRVLATVTALPQASGPVVLGVPEILRPYHDALARASNEAPTGPDGRSDGARRG